MYILSKNGHSCQISGHCKSLRPKDLQVFFNCEFSGVAAVAPVSPSLATTYGDIAVTPYFATTYGNILVTC